ncbi:MAG TPA: carbonic anhydrase [Verrucomicrobiae bacterium]|nr:carbonic anhydrase [Verrucomicrobiae bacterium]
MRLFEAIIAANHKAAAGGNAGLHPAEFADSLPVAALTCIDPRLNALIPGVLGIPEDQFIWLRNAGNIITNARSSTMRSLSLACAVKNAEEVVIIGHTDCQVCKTTTLQLLERLKQLGIERQALPDNVNEYFGLFSSERQNVIKGCEIVRSSPLIGPRIPVHGLLLDIQTGRLEWLVNGYEVWATMGEKWNEVVRSTGETVDKLKVLADFNMGEMKFPETRIGETVSKATDWLSSKVEDLQTKPAETPIGQPTATSPVANIAEQVIEIAKQHWPKPEDPRRRVPPRIPGPPPVRVKPGQR